MKSFSIILLALLSGAGLLHGQVEDADQATRAKCSRYAAIPLPVEADSVSTPKQWPTCESYKLYEGIDMSADFDAARSCAWSERLATQAGLAPRYTVASVFGGSAMLAVLYANGEGVEKSYPLALRFACESGWAPAEVEGRIEHLETLQAGAAVATTKFTFCDDTTSGAMQGFCAELDSETADQTRADDLRELSVNWTQPQLSAFHALVAAEKAYAVAHGKGEIDLTGTSRTMFRILAEQSLQSSFADALHAYETNQPPSVTAKAAAESELAMKLELKNAIAAAISAREAPGAVTAGMVQPQGIQDAQRAWLRYREAWLAFAKLRYPTVPRAAWLVLLNQDRIAVLKKGPCEADPDSSVCIEQQDTTTPRPLP